LRVAVAEPEERAAEVAALAVQPGGVAALQGRMALGLGVFAVWAEGVDGGEREVEPGGTTDSLVSERAAGPAIS